MTVTMSVDTMVDSSTLALAQTSQTFGLTRPRMVADNVLWIKGGRHMLYEMANEIYVGNDTELGKMRRLSEDGSELSDTNVENLVSLQGGEVKAFES